jgi:alkylation response protein AidB-like acyl-CoA dehydrogenase
MYRLNEEQTAVIEEVRRVADESIAPHAADVDAGGRFPREALDALAKARLLGLTVPVEYGGMGEGIRVACAALDEIARRCASTAMIYLMHVCGCSVYVARAQAVADTLRQVARGEHLTTLAWSEKGSRSHFWAPVNQAARNDGHVVLNAQKSWVTSAGEAEGYVVSSRTAGADEPTDTVLYLLLKEDEGFTVSARFDGLGMRGNASAPMTLEDCEIPAERALCEPSDGFRTMLEVVLPWFNLGNAAVSVGIAEAATSSTRSHLTSARLEHLDSRLCDLPNLRARLAKMRVETDRARAHLVGVIDAVENPDENTVLLVLESKVAASETAREVAEIGMQACGGAAFSRHLSVERNFRDVHAASVMAPTSDVLYDFIGRALCGMELF